MELLSNALAPKANPIIVVESLSAVCTYGTGGIGSRGWMTSPVGKGRFAKEGDRQKLGPVIKKLVERRQSQALKEGDMVMYRVLETSRTQLTVGTGVEFERVPTLSEWLDVMKFRTVRDGESQGLTPLRFAVFSNRCDLIQQLLDAGVAVETPLRRCEPRFEGMMQGQTVLHLACAIAEDAAMVHSLIKHGARPERKDQGAGMNALHYAAMAGNKTVVDALMSLKPELAKKSQSLGLTPWMSAVLCGQSQICSHMVEHYPDAIQTRQHGLSAASIAVSFVGDVDTLKCTIDMGADVNYVGTSSDQRVRLKFLYWAARTLHSLWPAAVRRSAAEQFAFCGGATALHRAAFSGNLKAINMLLSVGAVVDSIVHPWRMTPLHLASLRGHMEAVDVLLESGASPALRDARGIDAAGWALLRGHQVLASKLLLLREPLPGKSSRERWWKLLIPLRWWGKFKLPLSKGRQLEASGASLSASA